MECAAIAQGLVCDEQRIGRYIPASKRQAAACAEVHEKCSGLSLRPQDRHRCKTARLARKGEALCRGRSAQEQPEGLLINQGFGI